MTLREVVWKAFHLFSRPAALQALDNADFTNELHSLVQLTSRLRSGDTGLTGAKIEQLRTVGTTPVWYMSIVDGEDDEMLQDSLGDEFSDEPFSDSIPGNSTTGSGLPADEIDPASCMTVAVFALKPGARLPIHDHPKMFAIMKVLHGTLTVQSYSSVKCLETTAGHSIPQLLVEKAEISNVTSDSPSQLLYKNFHDVHTITNQTDGMALFIDIIAPPYDFRLPDDATEQLHSHRYITYYGEVGPASEELVVAQTTSTSPADRKKEYAILEEIECPSYYRTRHFQYEGPSLRLSALQSTPFH